MQNEITVAGPATAGAPAELPLLDAERLDVYRVALEFQALACSIRLGRGLRELRDQLDRASLSIVLNTAEGAGRIAPADKARFYTMARASAMESAAILDVLRGRALAPYDVCARGRGLLVRIVQMHTRLCQRLTAAAQPR
jgi:four helix bundle protein